MMSHLLPRPPPSARKSKSSRLSEYCVTRTTTTLLSKKRLVSCTLPTKLMVHYQPFFALEVPVTSRAQMCGGTRELRDIPLITSMQHIPLPDHPSSPLRLLVPQSAAKQAATQIERPKIVEPDNQAKYPESLFDPPSFDGVSDYLTSRYHRSEC